ncbi:MAG: AraC family transcriptional regulator [Eubacteriales bacterium]|jgi:AraC-like DNA-binding protein|nr:AraC family transcriptional regulator [Eubacteriales bacterium]MDO5586698.1 AraC family transcriptional regulator [Clostridia bacterium]MDY4212458.1 AraC family transcriptional regulator [Eubacteriales bacterium]
MPEYTGTRLNDEIKISRLYTVHYFEYSKRFSFTGESHDFWELVYADKGDVTVFADDKSFVLEQGNVIFHKPNEWHNVRANGVDAANITIITFASPSKAMSFFENKILSVGQKQKELLSKIVSEYTNAFKTPLNDPYTTHLERRSDAAVASEQLIKLFLCEFLILFLRNDPSGRQRTVRSIHSSDATLNLLINYMEQNITKTVTLKELMEYSGTNRTAIENIFRENLGKGAVEYFLILKIELAKKYLREDNYNITQISEILGYSSIHYFSRQFKKITGMTPTEYLLSIKAMMDN